MNSNKLSSKELKQVVDAQEKMAQAALGKASFEFPGSQQVKQQKGKRYQPNSEEQLFFSGARSKLLQSAVKWTLVGTAVPAILISYFRRNPEFAAQFSVKRQAFHIGLCGMAGSMWGMTSARLQLATDLSRLTHSPMASEARYQLWKINPNHPILNEFQSEIRSWDSYKISRDPIDGKNDYDEYNQKLFGDGVDETEMKNKKRDAFYKNRRRLGGSYEYEQSWDKNVDSFPPPSTSRW